MMTHVQPPLVTLGILFCRSGMYNHPVQSRARYDRYDRYEYYPHIKRAI